jgi:hypothetical protein
MSELPIIQQALIKLDLFLELLVLANKANLSPQNDVGTSKNNIFLLVYLFHVFTVLQISSSCFQM